MSAFDKFALRPDKVCGFAQITVTLYRDVTLTDSESEDGFLLRMLVERRGNWWTAESALVFSELSVGFSSWTGSTVTLTSSTGSAGSLTAETRHMSECNSEEALLQTSAGHLSSSDDGSSVVVSGCSKSSCPKFGGWYSEAWGSLSLIIPFSENWERPMLETNESSCVESWLQCPLSRKSVSELQRYRQLKTCILLQVK